MGDSNVPHAVKGSPCGNNFFRVRTAGLDGTTPIAIDPAEQDGDGTTGSVTETLVDGNVDLDQATATTRVR
jgi:hypothetical protein